MLLATVTKTLLERAIYSTISDQIFFDITTTIMPDELRNFIDKHSINGFTRNVKWSGNYVKDRKDAFERGDGKHMFMLGKIPVLLTIGTEQDKDGKKPSWAAPETNFTFSVPRPFKQNLLDFISGFVSLADDDAIVEYVSGRHFSRSKINPRFAKQEQFVVQSVYDSIDEVFNRMQSDEWYLKHDKPYKETIMLEGPPGTGKSTLVQHFVSKYQYDTYIAKPEDFACGNIRAALHGATKPIVVVFEELDACKLLCKPDPDDQMGYTDMSDFNYADFINWLNGFTPLDNIIVIITTNHKDKLLDSVYRNGRVDRIINVPYLNEDQLVGYIGEKWRKEINGYDFGRITVSMIPELRTVETAKGFHDLVETLSQATIVKSAPVAAAA